MARAENLACSVLLNTPYIMFSILIMFPNIMDGGRTQFKTTALRGLLLNVHWVLTIIDGDLWSLFYHLNVDIYWHLRFSGVSCLVFDCWSRRVWVSHKSYVVSTSPICLCYLKCLHTYLRMSENCHYSIQAEKEIILANPKVGWLIS